MTADGSQPVGVAAQAVAAPRELLADRAYSELRDRLVTLRILPGSPIDEDLLGEELGMGRTPVREAIKRLALENLVTVFPRRGTFAVEINITDLAHISDVRAQLEGHAAYRAAERLTEAHGIELAALLEELGHSAGERRRRGADGAKDTRVHRFIYRCAGNPYMEETLARYYNLSLRIWYLVLIGCRICSLACTSTTTCCTRSLLERRSARGRSSPHTSQRSSARFARCCRWAPPLWRDPPGPNERGVQEWPMTT